MLRLQRCQQARIARQGGCCHRQGGFLSGPGVTVFYRCQHSGVAGAGRRQGLCVRSARSEGGSAVIDNPTKTTPAQDKRTSSSFKKPPIYKVLLHNDTYNRREYVVKVLLKVIDGLGVDKAVNVMQEAHEYGLAMVIACAQEEAEHYCEGLRFNGLIATLES